MPDGVALAFISLILLFLRHFIQVWLSLTRDYILRYDPSPLEFFIVSGATSFLERLSALLDSIIDWILLFNLGLLCANHGKFFWRGLIIVCLLLFIFFISRYKRPAARALLHSHTSTDKLFFCFHISTRQFASRLTYVRRLILHLLSHQSRLSLFIHFFHVHRRAFKAARWCVRIWICLLIMSLSFIFCRVLINHHCVFVLISFISRRLLSNDNLCFDWYISRILNIWPRCLMIHLLFVLSIGKSRTY